VNSKQIQTAHIKLGWFWNQTEPIFETFDTRL